MADPDAFYLPTLRVEYDLPAVKLISNTAYFDRAEEVNGYSGTIYNLSYFQQFIAPRGDNFQYGYPSGPRGKPCSFDCSALYPLLTATGINLPGLPNYVATNLITNTQNNFTQEFRAAFGQSRGPPELDRRFVLRRQ